MSAIFLLVMSIGIFLSADTQQSAKELYEAAVFKKDADGDMQGAIKLFQEIVEMFSNNREIAAKAQLQIGVCYEKLGLKEAQKAYSDVVSKYPEQTETVRLAQEKLSRLQRVFAPSTQDAQEFSQRQVWAGNGVDNSGKISPDGRYLSYVNWMTGNLGVRDMSTGKNRNITKEGSWETDAAEFALSSVWSPDGKQLVYNWVKVSIDLIELYIVDLDGSKSRLLLQKKGLMGWFTPLNWSPDGKDILALLGEGRRCQLVLISLKDSSVQILQEFEEVDHVPVNAEFSPDGRYIVFDHPQKETGRKRNITVITSDGKQLFPFVDHSADDLLMGWSPDGKWILFKSDRTGTWDVWIIPVSEGSPQGEPILVTRGLGLAIPMGFSAD